MLELGKQIALPVDIDELPRSMAHCILGRQLFFSLSHPIISMLIPQKIQFVKQKVMDDPEKTADNCSEALKHANSGKTEDGRKRNRTGTISCPVTVSLRRTSPSLICSSAENRSISKAGSKPGKEFSGLRSRVARRKSQPDIGTDVDDLRVSVAEISRDLLNDNDDIVSEPVAKKNKCFAESVMESNPIGVTENESQGTIRSGLFNTVVEFDNTQLVSDSPCLTTFETGKADSIQTDLPAENELQCTTAQQPTEGENGSHGQSIAKENAEKFIKKTTSRGFTYIFVQSTASNVGLTENNCSSTCNSSGSKNQENKTSSKTVSSPKVTSPSKTKKDTNLGQESVPSTKGSELVHVCPYHGCDKAYAVRSSLLRHYILFPSHKPQIKKESHTASKECDLFLPKELTEYRRKARIRELFKRLSDDELKELAFPRLVKLLSAWEFLEKKCEKGYPKRVLPSVVFREFEGLRVEVEEKLSTMASDERKKMQIKYMPGLCNNDRSQSIFISNNPSNSETPTAPIVNISTNHTPEDEITSTVTPVTSHSDSLVKTPSEDSTIPVIPDQGTDSTSSQIPVGLTSVDLSKVMKDKFVPIAPKPAESQEETSEIKETSKGETRDTSLNFPYTYEPNGKVVYKLSAAKVSVCNNQSDFAVSEREFLKFLRTRPSRSSHLILETKDSNGKSFFKEFLMPLFQKNHTEQFVEFACNLALKYKVSQGQLKKYLRYNLGEKLKHVLGFNIFPPLDKLLPTLKKMKEDEEAKYGKENDNRVEKRILKKTNKEKTKNGTSIPPTSSSSSFTPDSEESSDLLADLNNELDGGVDFDPSSFMDMRPRQSASGMNKNQMIQPVVVPPSSLSVVASSVQTHLTTQTESHVSMASFQTPVTTYISSVPDNMQMHLSSNIAAQTVQSIPASVVQHQVMTTPLSVQILPPQLPTPTISPAPPTTVPSIQQSIQKSFTTTQSRQRTDSTQVVTHDSTSQNHMNELQISMPNPPRLLNTDLTMIPSSRNIVNDNPLGFSSQTQCRYFGIPGNEMMPLFGRSTGTLDRESNITRPVPSTTPITTIMSSGVTALPPFQPPFFTRTPSMISPTAFTPPQRLSMTSNTAAQNTSESSHGMFPPRTQNALHPQQFPHWFS